MLPHLRMPGSCCAPNCRSNYDTNRSSVHVYRFPSDPQLRAAWTKAVSREHFRPSKHTLVSVDFSVML